MNRPPWAQGPRRQPSTAVPADARTRTVRLWSRRTTLLTLGSLMAGALGAGPVDAAEESATAQAAVSPVARINFQPSSTPVPAGYTPDTGAAYSSAAGRGWVTPGTSTPVDMSALTRDRLGTTAEPRLRTLILLQPTPTQSPNGEGAWEYALPSGTYTVALSVGDPSFTDSNHRITVEGQVAVTGFVPTSAQPSLAATVTVPVVDGRLTVDARGGSNTKLQYVDIDRIDDAADTTPPTVDASVTGSRIGSGEYRNRATVSVEATDAGGVTAVSYSLDGAAFAAYTGPFDVTSSGTHTVQARAEDGSGNVGTSATSSFTVVEVWSAGNLELENVDGVPYPDRLIMNRIQSPVASNVVHDVATLRLRNTGTGPLTVVSLTVTGPFQLAAAPNLPAVVPAGGSSEVRVRFTATTINGSSGVWPGTLTIDSDDADAPIGGVQLAGLWQSVSEGGQERDLAEIAQVFGYSTSLTTPGVSLSQQGLVKATGDEVLSPYWLRANPNQPVGVRQLAAFHSQGNVATVSWHSKGSGTTTGIFTHAGAEGQSLLPHLNGTPTVYAAGSFSPGSAFGLKVDGEWSDPSLNDQTADTSNGCAGPCGHHVRLWPVRDRTGATVAHTWLMAMDYSGINYDYNDNVYLVTNVKPEVAGDPTAPAALPGQPSLSLTFQTERPGTLSDKDGQGTGYTSTQPNRNDTTPGSSSYASSLLDLDVTGTGILRLASSGTATSGSNSGSDNTLVNAARLPFDASTGTFSVLAGLRGPLAAVDSGSEQQGIQLGPDQDEYVKVAVVAANGAPALRLTAEQNGVESTLATTTPAGLASASTLDLALLGDPTARTVRAAYRVDSGVWTLLAPTLTLGESAFGRYFDRHAWAGLAATHKGGTPFTATYDFFAVVPGNVTSAAPPDGQALQRLDVAGAATYSDTLNRVWTPDTGLFSPSTAVDEGASATQEILATEDDVLYRTYRGNVGNVPMTERVLSYRLATGSATSVDLRLHFAERSSGNNAIGRRVFDIEVQSQVVRREFDIYAAAGGLNTAVVLPVRAVAVVGGQLDLALRASVDYPAIAAIEVLCRTSCGAPDTTPPDAVTGVTAGGSTSGNTVSWSASIAPDLAGYDVLRSATETGTYTKVNATRLTSPTYLDTNAPTGQSWYRVVAVDTSGNTSVPSSPATATRPPTADTTPPPAVTGVTATGTNTGITITWNPSPAGDLAGYSLYRAATATGTFTKITSNLLTTTSYNDTSLAPKQGASYYVTATDRTGNESPRSTTVSSKRKPR